MIAPPIAAYSQHSADSQTATTCGAKVVIPWRSSTTAPMMNGACSRLATPMILAATSRVIGHVTKVLARSIAVRPRQACVVSFEAAGSGWPGDTDCVSSIVES